MTALMDVVVKGENFDVDKTELESKDGVVRLLASLSESQSVSVEKSKSTWWQQISQNVDHITKAHPVTTRGTITVSAKEIDVEGIRGHVLELLKHLDVKKGVLSQKDITEICVHEHKKVEGPTKALVAVVSLAVTLATMGAGAELGLGLTSAMGLQGGATVTGIGTVTGASVVEGISTATATGLGAVSLSAGSAIAEGIASLTVAQSAVAATTAAVIQGMTQGAFTALCSRSAVSLLENRGNVGHVLHDLTSKESLKGIFSSSLISGLTAGLGEKLGITTKAPDLAKLTKVDFVKGCLGHLKSQMLKEGVSLTVHTAFDGGKFKDALSQSVRYVVSNVIGGVSSNVVGGLYHGDHIDTITHKLSHAIIGATEGAILGDVKAGALGAVISESLAEVITPSLPDLLSTDDPMAIVQASVDQAKIITAGIMCALGQDVEVAIDTASVAVENNFLAGMEDRVASLFKEDREEDEAFWTKRDEETKEIIEWVGDHPEEALTVASMIPGLGMFGTVIRGVARGAKLYRQVKGVVDAVEESVPTKIVVVDAPVVSKPQQRVDGKLFQEHHIISDKNPLTQKHDLWGLSGVRPDEKVNKILLPTVEGAKVSTTDRSIHRGRHMESVSRYLKKRMDSVLEMARGQNWTPSQYKSELFKIIREERQALKSGERILNKNKRPWAKPQD